MYACVTRSVPRSWYCKASMLPRLPTPLLTQHPTTEKTKVAGPYFQTLSHNWGKPVPFLSRFLVFKEEVKLLSFKANSSTCVPNPKIFHSWFKPCFYTYYSLSFLIGHFSLTHGLSPCACSSLTSKKIFHNLLANILLTHSFKGYSS